MPERSKVIRLPLRKDGVPTIYPDRSSGAAETPFGMSTDSLELFVQSQLDNPINDLLYYKNHTARDVSADEFKKVSLGNEDEQNIFVDKVVSKISGANRVELHRRSHDKPAEPPRLKLVE